MRVSPDCKPLVSVSRASYQGEGSITLETDLLGGCAEHTSTVIYKFTNSN